MSDFEFVLRQALEGIKRYPDELEELALQMHNVSESIQSECNKYDLPYDADSHIVSAP